jgi:hypothetical protein
VITHLFHGGNILASEKLDYSKELDSADLEGVVRGLMEGQHKAMLKRLQRGRHDPVILQRLGPDAFSQGGDNSDTMSELPPPDPEPPAVAARPDPATSQERLDRAFGEGVVSQKPLDEVVLEYLVSNARKRKRRP